MIVGAGQTQGYRRTDHHLGSLDDHACYVLNDAGITSLIIDPNPMFAERALGLLEKVPGLKQILTIRAHRRRGGSQRRGGEYLRSLWSPQSWRRTPSRGLPSRGTTGKPKGVMMTAQATST